MPARARNRTGLPRAFLTAALALLTLPAGAQHTPFRSAAAAVPVFVTVTDRDRRLVPGPHEDRTRQLSPRSQKRRFVFGSGWESDVAATNPN